MRSWAYSDAAAEDESVSWPLKMSSRMPMSPIGKIGIHAGASQLNEANEI
jgi:hypothetical protein